MTSIEEFISSHFKYLMVLALLPVCIVFLFPQSARSQSRNMDNMPGMNMNTSAPGDPATAAKRLADKQESERNHHLAGVLVVFAGVFILAEIYLAKGQPLVRYAWPACFIAAGLFLLVFSDTEIWPFGPQTPWYAITHSVEDFQHKIFAVILLTLGYVELQRARGKLTSTWFSWCFPVIGVLGAILLLFHVHGGDMQAPNAMETMVHIQKQHRWFATVGLGAALTNALAKTPRSWHQYFTKTWPALLLVLGVLLIRYTE